VAGYEIDAANGWIGTFFEGATLICPRQVVNDAVIAHRGALAGAPGVIVVAGTGSMIAAITDDGTVLESGRVERSPPCRFDTGDIGGGSLPEWSESPRTLH
jgi:glucosamine kinase